MGPGTPSDALSGQVSVPLRLVPLAMPRVWGGRRLAERYGKALPAGPVGESWEVVDRADEQSLVAGGPLDGVALHHLWTAHRGLFGTAVAAHPAPRFPLIVKLLDARDTLSVQVHPPAAVALELGGEPKTEAWYLAAADPGAVLYAGLRDGVGRAAFEAALAAGGAAVEGLLHTIPVAAGDALFLPSGRVHAIGAGCLIVEVQQNSDTTYRVWDFERPGLDGQPRELHLAEALRCIDFDDHEPSPAVRADEVVVECDLFRMRHWHVREARRAATPERCGIVVVLTGAVSCGGERFEAGATVLVPATCDAPVLPAGDAPAEVLHVELP